MQIPLEPFSSFSYITHCPVTLGSLVFKNRLCKISPL